jgi:hypothetical protein
MIKGEVWWANLPDDPYGSELGKRRPVLIIQNDLFNKQAETTEPIPDQLGSGGVYNYCLADQIDVIHKGVACFLPVFALCLIYVR